MDRTGKVYEVAHLATLGLTEERYATSDGMRWLLQMKKNKIPINSQKMRLRLEKNSFVVLDFNGVKRQYGITVLGELFANRNAYKILRFEMERFSLHVIHEPTAFISANHRELYSNVFAFIVHPIEMHLFQCLNISATNLVEDVKLALAGGTPYSLKSPFEDPRVDISSIGNEHQHERDALTLNGYFADIENFSARIQYASEAYRELQRQQRSKKYNNGYAETFLIMSARPPQEREFVDILQMFKHSFNLLARIKGHIHDPNSPDLVHFLFTPLELIVEASRDANGPGLPARVVSPLLTKEAIDLLTNCLSSRETVLWHSLGDAWRLSSEQYKGYVPPFMEGPWSASRETTPSAIGVVAADAGMKRLQAQQEDNHVVDNGRPERKSSPYSAVSSDDGFYYANKPLPPPPPPLPPPSGQPTRVKPVPALPKLKKPRDDELMQQELRTVLQEKKKIDILITPQVYINQNSTAEEVQEWLKVKGFSDRIRKQLSNMDGNELFRLKKAELEAHCGKDEGGRLDSQITVSRNTTGFKTTRSSELKAILAKARAKIESGNFEQEQLAPTPQPLYNKPSRSNSSRPIPRPAIAPNRKPTPKFNPRQSRYDDDDSDNTTLSEDESVDARNFKPTFGKLRK